MPRSGVSSPGCLWRPLSMAKFGHFRRRSCRPSCSDRAEAIGSCAKLAPSRTALDRCVVRDGARIRRSDPHRLILAKNNRTGTTAPWRRNRRSPSSPPRPPPKRTVDRRTIVTSSLTVQSPLAVATLGHGRSELQKNRRRSKGRNRAISQPEVAGPSLGSQRPRQTRRAPLWHP